MVSFSKSNVDSFQQIQIVFLNQLSPPFNLTSLFEIQFLRRNSAKIKANAAHVLMYIYMGRGLSEKKWPKFSLEKPTKEGKFLNTIPATYGSFVWR